MRDINEGPWGAFNERIVDLHRSDNRASLWNLELQRLADQWSRTDKSFHFAHFTFPKSYFTCLVDSEDLHSGPKGVERTEPYYGELMLFSPPLIGTQALTHFWVAMCFKMFELKRGTGISELEKAPVNSWRQSNSTSSNPDSLMQKLQTKGFQVTGDLLVNASHLMKVIG